MVISGWSTRWNTYLRSVSLRKVNSEYRAKFLSPAQYFYKAGAWTRVKENFSNQVSLWFHVFFQPSQHFHNEFRSHFKGGWCSNNTANATILKSKLSSPVCVLVLHQWPLWGLTLIVKAMDCLIVLTSLVHGAAAVLVGLLMPFRPQSLNWRVFLSLVNAPERLLLQSAPLQLVGEGRVQPELM